MASNAPSYSPEAEISKAFLLREYNDIDVFIEDADGQTMYRRILRLIVGQAVRLENVYPLGSRTAVLARCAEDQADRQRRRIYIIDGDFDCLLESPVPPLRHLYRLSVYCIENLLLSERGLLEIAADCSPHLTLNEVEQNLDIQPLLDHCITHLTPLFIIYATIIHLNLGVETVGYTVHRLLDKDTPNVALSPKQILQRKTALLRQIIQSGNKHAAKKIILQLNNKVLSAGNRGGFISGKSYLLPLIHKHLTTRFALKDSLSRLKARLASYYDPDIEPGLRDAITRALNEENA